MTRGPRLGASPTVMALALAALGVSALAAEAPRLGVLISLDQFPQRHLERALPYLEEGGFKRLIAQGAWFTDARHLQAATYTGPGHAVQVTGAYGRHNGVVGNRMYLEERGRSADPVRDARYSLLASEDYGASPWSLTADSLGDSLWRATGGRGKVVSVALKDRAAVLMAGRKGTAVWFSEALGRFVSSSYYGERLPSWLADLNRRRLPEADFGGWWSRRGPDEAYAGLPPDDHPAEGDWEGLRRAFPHQVVGKDYKRTKSYFKAWATSAFGLWGQRELVEAAVLGEGLGRDDLPDLLCVGVTSLDYAGHQFGPDSHEVASLVLETDAVLRELLAFLDREVGAGRYVVALTSDHGAGPIPELMSERGESAGRLRIRTIRRAVDRALSKRFGRGRWVLATEAPFVTLNRRLVERRGLDPSQVETTAAAALRTLTGVEAVFTRGELTPEDDARDGLGRLAASSFHPERSGDLVVLTKPYWIWGKYGERQHGATHGSPWEYDTRVPLIFFGAGVVPGRHDGLVEMISLAPTLAALLGVPQPGDAKGRALAQVVDAAPGGPAGGGAAAGARYRQARRDAHWEVPWKG